MTKRRATRKLYRLYANRFPNLDPNWRWAIWRNDMRYWRLARLERRPFGRSFTELVAKRPGIVPLPLP